VRIAFSILKIRYSETKSFPGFGIFEEVITTSYQKSNFASLEAIHISVSSMKRIVDQQEAYNLQSMNLPNTQVLKHD